MKKIISLLLAILMVVSMAACGAEEAEEPVSATEEQESKAAEETVAEETVEEKASEDAEEVEPEAEAPAEEAATIDFEEITVVDNEFCTIKITGLDPKNEWGYTLNAYLENKSADKTYLYSVTSASVNGVACDPTFAAEISPGKKANEKINLLDLTLEENGIVEYTDIELTFTVYDSDDWFADPVAKETIHVYPLGEDKAETFVREPQEADVVLVDDESITVIVTGYTEDDFWGYVVNLYLVNKTESTLIISADNVSVNGFMADPLYGCSLPGGKCAFSTMSWTDTALEENGISAVEEIEFTLSVYDENSWEECFNETLTLTPGA